MHYCGHRIADADKPGRFPAGAEATAAARIAEVVAREHPPGYAYGSLASGADILWAEALLEPRQRAARRAALRARRVHRELGRARRPRLGRALRTLPVGGDAVSYATDDAYLDDDVLYRYGTELAMGLALLRGRYLDADVRQLARLGRRSAAGAASTAIDVATWRRRGLPATIVTPLGERLVDAPSFPEPSASSTSGRVVCAMLFADVRGFSKLTDEELPRFAEHVLAAFATVLDRHAEHILHRNTWGDALYVVLRDAPCAAACALELQEAMSAIDLAAARLPAHLALRLGGHVGPVFPILDPVLRLRAYMGSHVSRTARIEPVTPAAAVYVTEPFAAALALAGPSEPACDYVGHMAAAKDYGRLRMYRLRR